MESSEQERSIQQVVRVMKEQLARWQMITAHFAATNGVVIASSDFSEDGEPGKAVTYRFTTAKNEIIEAKYQSTIHWPSGKGWEDYVKRMSVGATVPVLFDPDNPSDNVAFVDIPALERSIAAVREQLQGLEMSLRPK